MINSKFTILTFYKFKQIKDLLLLKSRISDFCKFNKIKGTIILAEEGINGTIAGYAQSIKNFELEIKDSESDFSNLFQLNRDSIAHAFYNGKGIRSNIERPNWKGR